MLYVVATPLGNLDDLSPRARATLEAVDLIAAEDTRHTGHLLAHFGITTHRQSLHEHNERQVVPRLVRLLQEGRSIALVSDAGTPLISDPGYRLVSAALAGGVRVSPIPGPSACIAALSVAGLPSDRFAFEGFLPARPKARRERIAALRAETRTLVFYEAVHRIADALDDLVEILAAERRAFLGRELSKAHEQCCAATLGTLQAMLVDGRITKKGEFVLVVEGAGVGRDDDADEEARRLLGKVIPLLPGKRGAALVAELLNRRPNDMYRLMLDMQGRTDAD